jgi:hypothetical protein
MKSCNVCGVVEASVVEGLRVNPENEQRTEYTDMCVECAHDAVVEMELAPTDSHYSWSSITGRYIAGMRDAKNAEYEEEGEQEDATRELTEAYSRQMSTMTHSTLEVSAQVEKIIKNA